MCETPRGFTSERLKHSENYLSLPRESGLSALPDRSPRVANTIISAIARTATGCCLNNTNCSKEAVVALSPSALANTDC